MIAKGSLHNSGAKLAAYLVKGKAGELAEMVEMRGFAASDLRDAFRDVEIQARDTKAQAPFLHLYTRFAPGEMTDTPENRALCLTIMRREIEALGYGKQGYAISFHTDRQTRELHVHAGINRIARNEDGKAFAIDPGLYKNRLKELSRECEWDYGLHIVSSDRQPGDRARAAGRNEVEEARRLGISDRAIRTAILDCLERADSGRAFKAALEYQNLMLANGDRRDCFMVIDEKGGHHALNKKLTGMTLAEIRDRFADLDRSQLPTVNQAQAMQRARTAELEQHAAAKGRVDDIRPEIASRDFSGTASRTTDPSRRSEAQAEPTPPPKVMPEYARETVQPEIRPLGKTAGEIRLAWQLTDTALQFAQEIENRGLILVHVSREEAEASHRAHAFAQAIDRQNRELREGFAVVDQRGNVTRIDQRTTGDQLEEIQKRLGGIDTSELVSVADAKEIMREANRAAWAEQQRAEREQARPATGIETTIADALKATMTGTEFAEAVDKAGLRIARANVADLPALDALRRDDELAAASGLEATGRHFAKLEIGDFAAVTNAGDVFRLNPYKLDFAEIENRLADIQPRMPSVTEARAINEIIREQTAAQWADIRAGNAEARVANSEAIAAEREGHHQAAETARDVRAFNQEIGEAVDTTEKAASRLGSSFAKAVETILGGFFSFFDSGPKLTKDQAERAEMVAEEKQQARAEHAAEQEKADAVDWAQFERNRQQQYDDFMNGRSSSRERQRERDDDDYGRERERDRGYER
jgi:Relaxase/Mobilisation nuclease domain